MSKISVQARMERFFYRELIKYLKLAEERRRWNLFTDIPWREANPNSSSELADITETFCGVELYLPDFTSKMLHMIRRSRGRAWFHVNWGYEESKHSMTLETWLLASGHRSEEQRRAYEESLLGQEWELPFDHPRQMVCYTMVQELATFWNYRNLEAMAIQEKDFALVAALRLISVDERVHYRFYGNAVKEWMRHDEAGTIEDLRYVFDHFTMPGNKQIPGYDERAKQLAKSGIYGPREYVKLVKNPILEDLGLGKDFQIQEQRAAQLELERATEAERLDREIIVVGDGYATPRQSPLLEAIGFSSDRIETLRDIALGRSLPTPEARPIDEHLLVLGDELSNNPEELRTERQKRRKNRMKNDRLRKLPSEVEA